MASPASSTAARARSSCASERTKTPNSCGSTPALTRSASQSADVADLVLLGLERPNRRRRAVEHGDGVAAVLAVAVHIGHLRPEQPVRLHADLVGGAVVDAQGAGAAADVHAEGLPGERLLEDALAEVAGEEQRVGPIVRPARRRTADARR